MRAITLFALPLAVALVGAAAAFSDGPTPPAAPGAPGAPSAPAANDSPYIDWQATLVGTFERAKKENKPILIAVNAERVDGKDRVEPAGKELRENTYHDAGVVKKSREFVCTMVKPDANSADYGELRSRFGIDGVVVSPQHIFAHPDGSLIDRKEYWPYKAGVESVEALLGLMDAALAAHKAKLSGAGAPAAGSSDEQRAAWIRDRIGKIRDASTEHPVRDLAIKDLVKGDQKGDCIDPLCLALVELKKDVDTQIAILKALGKPGLELAVPTVVGLLDDKNDDVRSNAAVTLEYIGSATAVEPLTKRLSREKDDFAFNNGCRALGRCGAKQDGPRKALIHEMQGAKSDRLMAGPAIGLSYFEKDAEAARAIEKVVAKEGLTWKRSFLLWALTEIHDPKSADFVKEKVQKNEKNPMVVPFVNAVVSVLSGNDEGGTSKNFVDGGLGYAVGAVGGIGGSARKDRDQSEWKPKGEVAPPPGGGPGGRGGPPGMGG